MPSILLVAHELGDLRNQVGLVDLVGNLGDDDGDALALLRFLEGRLAAHDESASAFTCRRGNACAPDDGAARRKVRAGDGLHHGAETFFRRRVPALDHRDDAVDHFAHVVRRNVRGHADRDARRAVDQQAREWRRQHGGLVVGLVEGRPKIDGVLVQVRHHRFGERLETRFRIAVGRGRIAVDGAEIALAVDQGVAHVEVLREADERVVRRRVAVRMVVADDFTDDLRALAIGPSRGQPHLPHGEQHPPVRRLEAIPNVR